MHAEPRPIRFAHISDLHVTTRCRWGLRDRLNKRLFAWLNLHVGGRRKRFRFAEQVLSAFRKDLHERQPDHIIFSGDATAMGFEEELRHAVDLLRVGHAETPTGLAVPGNHDYCTHTAARAGHFEQHFAPWLVGERIGVDIYPYAQRVGHVWLVAVNSATSNTWPWDARGQVGLAQLNRLEALFQRLDAGPRILVTHYPVYRSSGHPEHRFRALRDLPDLLSVARGGGVGLWLHGHRHDTYFHPPSHAVPFPVFCAGSTTQQQRWTYLEYTIETCRVRAIERVFDLEKSGFREGRVFDLDMPGKG